MREVHVSTDVETDGPIPGPHSMLSFGSAAFVEDGTLIGRFSANLETLPGADGHPVTMKWWGKPEQRLAWEECRKNTRPPEEVMDEYLNWVNQLPGKPVFVGYPAAFDFMFIQWYLVKFTDKQPFSHSGIDIKTYSVAMLARPYSESGESEVPGRWLKIRLDDGELMPHRAVDDAVRQGRWFMNTLKENLGLSQFATSSRGQGSRAGRRCGKVYLRAEGDENAKHAKLEADYSTGLIYVCDFRVPGIEEIGEEGSGGYQWGRVINVDHHARTSRMQLPISSTNLAIDRVRAFGRPDDLARIVINHTDCDSVLSAAILAGDLNPEERFKEAAVAADHTGEMNVIADLLQALRHKRDYELSLRNLRLLLARKPLEDEAQEALDKRKAERREASELARERFRTVGCVSYAELDRNVDGCLFLPHLPEAAVIVYVLPSNCSKGGTYRHGIKLWLGKGHPEGLTLFALCLKESGFDPYFDGRWNAGSNCRNGGTHLHSQEYAKGIAERIDAWFSSSGRDRDR